MGGNDSCATHVTEKEGRMVLGRKTKANLAKRFMTKRVRVFTIAVGIWAFTVLLGSVYAADDPMMEAGVSKSLEIRRAPDFSLEDLDGNRVNLMDIRGKIVLLDFWTTW